MPQVGKKNINVLIILDGWGIAPHWGGNAISEARTKNYNQFVANFPNTSLLASGQAVGLPTNSPGNSEAGHLNLGAGHIVRQDITLIDQSIENGNFFRNPTLSSALLHSKKYKSNIHLLGLLSSTGTHSHVRHLYSLLELIKKNGITNPSIHLFSDGRDADPLDGIIMAEEVENKVREIGVGQVASLSGRFFAMDRDNRWGRISRTYNLLTKAQGNRYQSLKQAFAMAYASGQTDEFIEPRIIAPKTESFIPIKDNDVLIFFNFRSDRTKELISAFVAPKLPDLPDRLFLKNLFVASFAIYEDGNLAKKVFVPEQVRETLAEVLSINNISQCHIAETEKYPHITYYLNGGIEKPYRQESRVLIPSPKNVKTYDYQPKMSALEVKQAILLAIKQRKSDFIIANFANADMVGHTGNLKATIHAVEFIDECLGEIAAETLACGGNMVLVGDHGNAEQMVNPRTGLPDTEHTNNPVPFVLIPAQPELRKLKFQTNGVLASVAPTLLELAGLAKPASMVNESLIIKELNVAE